MEEIMIWSQRAFNKLLKTNGFGRKAMMCNSWDELGSVYEEFLKTVENVRIGRY